MKIAERERDKYQQIWGFPSYSNRSPGLEHVDMFCSIANPRRGASIMDIGAGSGAASSELKSRGFFVRAFDLTHEAWKHPDIPLTTGTIWRDIHGIPDYAYCCDVMEHIPTEFVALSIREILDHCGRAFFSISFLPDQMGALIGQDLHLTVRPFTWWRDLFREMGILLDARDLLGEGIFYVENY